MYFLDTNMHLVTFFITMFEVFLLVFHIIYFLQRPGDNSRARYLILILCLIAYNTCGGLFPDPGLPIPIAVQTVVAFLTGFAMSMYGMYFFYKLFDLTELKFFATRGLVFFLLLPFLSLFLVPFLITNDVRLSARLAVIIPFFYGLTFFVAVTVALFNRFKQQMQLRQQGQSFYSHAIVAIICIICWIALPVLTFFGDFQVLEHSIANLGFLLLTIIYVRSAIKQSHLEYKRLIDSESSLQKLNASLKKKVRQRTKKLEMVMKERETTFINLAHETKTPLTLINNYLNQYITQNGSDDKLRIIKQNIDRLTNDIIDLFHIESYEKGFGIYDHNKMVDVSSLLECKQALFELHAAEKGVGLTYSIQPMLRIKGHPGAIERITNNLIENAIKYSGMNGRVKVKLYSKDNELHFTVTDNGSGIPEHLKEKIFEPYFKLSVPGASNEGLGMGLSIAKRIVQDLNGHVNLLSCERGTKICVILPLLTQEDHGLLDQNLPDGRSIIEGIEVTENTPHSKKHHILIVEDNLEMLKFLVQQLGNGNHVTFAESGTEALDKMEHLTQLDLIISDVMMPDMDGFEFCMAVQREQRYSHIPFIFLTAKATAADKIRGLEVGGIDYIEKPFRVDALIKKVDSILCNLEKQRAAVVTSAYSNLLTSQRTADSSHENVFVNNCCRYRLTSREIEIVGLLMKGQPYKLIADQLHISDKTVGKHIANIFAKAGVNNKVELMNKLTAIKEPISSVIQ